MHNYRDGNKQSRGGTNSRGFKPKFNRFSRGTPKPLDSRMFIKNPTNLNIEAQVFVPEGNFSEYKIIDKLKRNIQNHGYTVPTEIQDKAIPQILDGKDVIGIANTGTGKTAAFLITLINKCFLDRNQRVLIVVPTRELAVQIKDEFRIFAAGTELHAVSVIGGENIRKQIYTLRHNPHFVIGTPGRIKDLIEKRELNLMLFQNVVLDEVDRMVDIGFLNDIKYIISLLPKKRQSLFFSATVDNKTQDILRTFVSDPITVSVKQQDTSESISQDIIRVPNKSLKINILVDLLRKPEFNKVLIFGRTKWGMEKLTKELILKGFKAASIHGNKSQNQRQRALSDFKDNKIQILIATDIASRGIDVDEITHVINYDAPATYEDYIHRIGRTGRAGLRGQALTFVEN